MNTVDYGHVLGAARGYLAQAQAALAERLEGQRIDAHQQAHGPYLLGDAPCVADFYLVMLMRWSRNSPSPATDAPQLAALAQRMKARPAFKTLYEREGLSEWA